MLKPTKLIIGIPVLLLLFFLFTGFAFAEGNKVGTVTGNMLNVRETPSTSAKILTQLPKGTKVKVLESSNDWYKINYHDTTGWVFGEFLTVRDEAIGIGTINAYNVNVRADHDISSEIITRLTKGDKVDVFERFGDWYRIQVPGEKFGWVFKDYIRVNEANVSRGAVEDTAVKAENSGKKGEGAAKEEEQDIRQKIVEYAKKFLGVKYVYGGSSPKGFDCSGFVQYVFKQFGIKLERTSASQGSKGEKISKSELKPADLVFFDTNGGLNAIEHVGIYIGNGKFIHASSGSSARKVIISDLTEGFYKKTYMGARRYVK